MIFLRYVSARRGTHLFCVFLFLSLSLAAQDLDKIASLRSQLKDSKGEARFDLLNKIAFEYRSAFPDSAISFGLQAIDYARTLGLKKGLATSLNYIGLGNYYKGNLVRAFEYYEQAEQQATNDIDSVQLGYAQNNIGRLFAEQGMVTQSYPYFAKAESIFKSTNDVSGLAYVYQSFASLYKTEREFVKSEQRYQEALRIRLQLGNTRDIMSGMLLLGKLYMDIKRYDDALLYFQKADSAGHVINDALGLAEIKILMTCGFNVTYAYTSEREILLLFDIEENSYERNATRFISILAGEASAKLTQLEGDLATFDSRVLALPSKGLVVDYFQSRTSKINGNSWSYWKVDHGGKRELVNSLLQPSH